MRERMRYDAAGEEEGEEGEEGEKGVSFEIITSKFTIAIVVLCIHNFFKNIKICMCVCMCMCVM